MIALVENNKISITKICKNYSVTELYLFGSALTNAHVPNTSDIDFAVIFDPDIPPIDMADYYFGLIEDLEDLFKCPVDLVTLKSIKNRIFKDELERTMIPLYAA